MSLTRLLERPKGRVYSFAFVSVAIAAAILYASGATALAVGEIVRLTTRFRVMQPDLTTGVGIQEAGATGTITAGPVRSSLGRIWWFVDFDTGPDGWVNGSVLASNSTSSAPVVNFSAAPTTVAAGASTTLTWSSTGATSCTSTGTGFAGTRPVSGSVTVAPTATTTFGLSCTGTGGTTARQVTVTVSAPGGAAPVVTLTASPALIASGGSSTLSWTSTNATSCTASGDTSFSGTVATSGTRIVSPATSRAYTLTCSGPGGNGSAVAIVDVGSSGTGAVSAFSDPDNGNIPDRALHPIAFPTAVGFGRATSVRSPNAVVYKINSLLDVADPNDGIITYRECALALAVNTPYAIPAGRPRYCVFDVAGAISLNAPAWITTPKIYIAGQTSPGGIEFRLGANYNPVDSLIDSRRGGDHMIVRHIRARTGEHVGRTSMNGDPIRINGTKFQIIDHVSSMFGTDESLELSGCTNCTVQWSIIGPNICRNAGHTSALHCKTFFLKPAGNVTVAYNLSQHGEQRGLNASPGVAPVVAGTAMQIDMVNNVLYHFLSESGLISNQFGHVYANYVGNVSLRGPRFIASDGNFLIGLYGAAAQNPNGFDIYASNNVTPQARIAGQFGQTVTDPFRDAVGMVAATGNTASTVCALSALGQKDCSRIGKAVVQDVRPAVAPGNAGLSVRASQIGTPEQAMRAVLSFAGADMCRDGNCRDNVDRLYIDDVSTCDLPPYLMERDWTSTVAASGGWAQITPGAAKPDSDNDGMPDDWESRFRGTNPRVWDANADPDGDGYPNIEEYLNWLAKDDVRYNGILTSGTARLPASNCNRARAPIQ